LLGDLPVELPAGYGENTLVLLVQNCSVLFTYWEVSAASREFLKGKELALRLCSVNNGSSSPCAVVSPCLTQSWYFRKVAPGRRYRSELGWRENGEFYPLLCSEAVDVPPGKTAWVPGQAQEAEKEAGSFTEAFETIGVSSGILQNR